jgi:hypothetical protein
VQQLLREADRPAEVDIHVIAEAQLIAGRVKQPRVHSPDVPDRGAKVASSAFVTNIHPQALRNKPTIKRSRLKREVANQSSRTHRQADRAPPNPHLKCSEEAHLEGGRSRSVSATGTTAASLPHALPPAREWSTSQYIAQGHPHKGGSLTVFVSRLPTNTRRDRPSGTPCANDCDLSSHHDQWPRVGSASAGPGQAGIVRIAIVSGSTPVDRNWNGVRGGMSAATPWYSATISD